MGRIVLITGGARSGKSAFALARAKAAPAARRVFVATAVSLDAEMAVRIRRHQEERGQDFQTVEAPRDLVTVLDGLDAGVAAVVDCLTVWLGNTWHHGQGDQQVLDREIAALVAAVGRAGQRPALDLFLVTNEVGWGIVPLDAAVRAYRDAAGRLNAAVAAVADEVHLCVSGLSLQLKPQKAPPP